MNNKNNKYSNGLIYKICSKHSDKFYVGSTTQKLEKRLHGHVRDYRRHLKNKYNYVTSFDIIKLGDYSIELLEDFPCENKYDLNNRERYYIEKNKTNVVNKCIPNRTPRQYQTLESYKQYQQKFYQNNKDKINQIHSCECGKAFTHSNKTNHNRTKKHQNYIKSKQIISKQINEDETI